MLGFGHWTPDNPVTPVWFGASPLDPVTLRTPTGDPFPQGRRSAPSSGPTSAPRGAWGSGRTMPGPLLRDTPCPWVAGNPRPGAGPTGHPKRSDQSVGGLRI